MRGELSRRLPALLLIPAALSLSGCGVTSSTEVGVRTGLFGTSKLDVAGVRHSGRDAEARQDPALQDHIKRDHQDDQ